MSILLRLMNALRLYDAWCLSMCNEQIVLHREKEVMQCECEMPFVHGLLSRIPDDLPFELLITQTGDLFIQYPPNVLEDEARLQYERYAVGDNSSSLSLDSFGF